MANHLLQPRLQPIAGNTPGFFNEGEVHIRSLVESIWARDGPKEKNFLSRRQLVQRVSQPLPGSHPQLLAALHAPFFSSFQEIHRSPIIRRGAVS